MSLINIAFVLVFVGKILFSESYNFDTKFPEIISSGHKNDYFGFSVLLQRGTTSNIIVGAVLGNSTFVPNSGNSPGVVYKCPLTGSNTCFEYRIGHEVPDVDNLRAAMDHELFGVTIDGGQNVGDPIVMCAPMLSRQTTYGYYINGGCFILNNSSLTTEHGEFFTPLSDLRYQIFGGRYFYGTGQAGMSLNFLEEYSQILIGAPGVLMGAGSLIRCQLKKPSGQASKIVNADVPHPYYYRAKLVGQDSYLSYSSSYGIFDENRGLWYIAAAPRASLMRGKVVLFSYPSTNEESIIVHNEFLGEQMGAYYGFSLLAFKNNDNTTVSDLLVGAPMFSLKGYDEGCVYYYKNGGRAYFSEPIKIFGDITTSGSRFGYAIANMGDINQDSYTDIAVSAPYESREGGAVYIFLGRSDGLSNKYSQKITGRSLDHKIVALGLSLSRGLDVDQNTFNDLAIGDYKSGKVVVIKSKPVIKYFASIKPDVAELAVAQFIQFNLKFCLGYDSPNSVVKSVLTDLYYFPDPRILMENTTRIERTVTIKLGKTYCENLSLTVTNNTINSFATPIRFKINYEVKNQSNSSEFCKTCPMTDPNESNSIYLDLPLVSGCKMGSLCLPDLSVSAKFDPNLNYLVLGKNSVLNMKVQVTNLNEPAYLCELLLKIPDNIEMRRIPNKCTHINTELHCFLRNVLFKSNITQIDFEFDLTKLTYLRQEKVNFYVEVKSSGNDTNEDNNKINLVLPLKVDSFVQINGESQPDQLMYEDMVKFSHKYSFVNLGPSPLHKLNFVVNFPIKIDAKEFVSKYSLQNTIDGVEIECKEELSQSNPLSDTPYNEKKDSSTNKTFVNFPPSQIFFLNCTERGLVSCKKLLCNVNQEFKKDQIIRLDFSLEIAVDKIRKQMENKRIILFQTGTRTSYSNETTCVKTIVMTSDGEVSYKFYIIGVVIGVIILSGIIFLLHKLKFFRRPLMEKLENAEETTSVVDNDSLEYDDE